MRLLIISASLRPHSWSTYRAALASLDADDAAHVDRIHARAGNLAAAHRAEYDAAVKAEIPVGPYVAPSPDVLVQHAIELQTAYDVDEHACGCGWRGTRQAGSACKCGRSHIMPGEPCPDCGGKSTRGDVCPKCGEIATPANPLAALVWDLQRDAPEHPRHCHACDGNGHGDTCKAVVMDHPNPGIGRCAAVPEVVKAAKLKTYVCGAPLVPVGPEAIAIVHGIPRKYVGHYACNSTKAWCGFYSPGPVDVCPMCGDRVVEIAAENLPLHIVEP